MGCMCKQRAGKLGVCVNCLAVVDAAEEKKRCHLTTAARMFKEISLPHTEQLQKGTDWGR